MYTCWASHLEMNPNRFTTATIAQFSASEHILCALVVRDSKWVTVLYTARFCFVFLKCFLFFVFLKYSPNWLQRWLVAVDMTSWCHVRPQPLLRSISFIRKKEPLYKLSCILLLRCRHMKDSKESFFYYDTDTQTANVRSNSLCQPTKRHLNNN